MAAGIANSAAADEQLREIESAYQSSNAITLTELTEQTEGENKFVAQYRLASLHLGNNQMAEAKELLNTLRASLENETSANPDNAEAWALLASSYGMLTTLDQGKAMEYGQNAGMAESRALATGSDNPMVLLLTGINKFYTPKEWGGGHSQALSFFDRAVTAYQADNLERRWGYADALVWRGSAHVKLGNLAQAEADVNAAIAMAPDYQWAKSVLDTL
ncbi:MAG TPA: hypothetical protein VGP45_07025 [Marinobacter sp.]|nr:hypothetical protein [Marinobacter sp.]